MCAAALSQPERDRSKSRPLGGFAAWGVRALPHMSPRRGFWRCWQTVAHPARSGRGLDIAICSSKARGPITPRSAGVGCDSSKQRRLQAVTRPNNEVGLSHQGLVHVPATARGVEPLTLTDPDPHLPWHANRFRRLIEYHPSRCFGTARRSQLWLGLFLAIRCDEWLPPVRTGLRVVRRRIVTQACRRGGASTRYRTDLCPPGSRRRRTAAMSDASHLEGANTSRPPATTREQPGPASTPLRQPYNQRASRMKPVPGFHRPISSSLSPRACRIA